MRKLKMNRLFSAAALLAFALTAGAQNVRDSNTAGFDQVVDRAIQQENSQLATLRTEHPIAETYIQDMRKDSDFGRVPRRDHYFLGKVDLSNGVSTDSFIPKSDTKTRAFAIFTNLFSVRYLPRGFAQMMLIDNGAFDRRHYDFEFVRREYLGDVRTWVINVRPRKGAGRGRFIGQIWVETRDFNIVRFNGTYINSSAPEGSGGKTWLHFDSWRVNSGPNLWVPARIYTAESSLGTPFRKSDVKAVTNLWGYSTPLERNQGEFTNITVEMPEVEDKSPQAADNSPVESLRAWERQGEDNVLSKMEKASILAPKGDVDKVLETVINNVMVTNNLNITPEVRARVILTTPLETFTVGHTIVISRGMLDTLPDEASLAAILTHELAHIALGQEIDTKFAFSDRVMFDDEQTLRKFRFTRPQSEEEAANEKAVSLLGNSPYKDQIGRAGLFLKALGAEADQLPNLIKPLFGSRIADHNNVLRMAALLEKAPELQTTRVDQVAALPLGSRTSLDPWTDQLRMLRTRNQPLLSAHEKMPFELTPVYLHLTYQIQPGEQISEVQPAPPQALTGGNESPSPER
jgi:hypothetical protein